MKNGPFYTHPGVADFEKRVVRVFVLKKLIALFQKIEAMIGMSCILNTTIFVFSPGKVNDAAVVG
jgi:hypothetical protein